MPGYNQHSAATSRSRPCATDVRTAQLILLRPAFEVALHGQLTAVRRKRPTLQCLGFLALGLNDSRGERQGGTLPFGGCHDVQTPPSVEVLLAMGGRSKGDRLFFTAVMRNRLPLWSISMFSAKIWGDEIAVLHDGFPAAVEIRLRHRLPEQRVPRGRSAEG
jgi:hypothetical protein